MCTVILFYHIFPDYPIVLAGNRDEFLVRDSLAPHLWEVENSNQAVKIFAGKDLKANGTWFGINQHGLVAGLTNRYTGTRDPLKASRGRLVLDCLAQDSPDKAQKVLKFSDTALYNPFNLFCLSRKSGFFLVNYPQPRLLPIQKGIHILTNQGIEETQDPKKRWLYHQLQAFPNPPDNALTLPSLFSALLASHGEGTEPPPICIHLEGYGTVSSFLLLLGSQREKNKYLFCNGPPCSNPYEDLTPLLRKLLPPE